MMAPRHRIIGGTTGFVVSTAVLSPDLVSVAIGLGAGVVAAAFSTLPDDAEKWLRLRHRKITHRPINQLLAAGVPAGAAIYFGSAPMLTLILAGCVATGLLMHSVADGMTVAPGGIQYLWPISRRGYHLLPRSCRVWVGTNSWSEHVFAFIWCLFVLIYAYARFGHLIPS